MSDERRAAIMRAVYCALCTHGYADLTMQDIADEAEVSKGALHYHYDTKGELLIAFLEHLYERYTERLREAEATAGGDPADRLEAVLDAALFPPERADLREFRTAVLEIKAQAPYEPAYREHLAEFDAFLHDQLRAIVAEGVDQGRFAAGAEPDVVASFVITVINGAQTRSVAVDHPLEAVREQLTAYVERELLTGQEVEPA